MQRCAHSLSTASALRTIFFPTSSQTYISTFLAPSYATDAPSNFSRSMSTATSVITAPSTTQRSYSSNSFAGQTQHYQQRLGQQHQPQPQHAHQQQQQHQPYSRLPHRDRQAGNADQRSHSNNRSRRPSGPAADAAALRQFGVQRDRRPMNEEIIAREVLLIGGLSGAEKAGRQGGEREGSEAGGSGNGNKASHERVSKSQVLSQLDLSTHCLVQVGLDGVTDTAICRVMERKEYFDYEQRRGKTHSAKSGGAGGAASGATRSTKQLELNWTIDTNDVRHRLKKALELLDKGHKLEVALMPKKRQKPAPPEQCHQLIETLTTAIKDAGHKMAKPMEGKVGANATFYFDPKPQQKQQAAPAVEVEKPAT